MRYACNVSGVDDVFATSTTYIVDVVCMIPTSYTVYLMNDVCMSPSMYTVSCVDKVCMSLYSIWFA